MDLQQKLTREHERVETLLEAMKEAVRCEDKRSLCETWRSFERALTEHMAFEEREILPAFAEVDPVEASALLEDHADFRRILEELGVCLDLHTLRAAISDDLLARLRAHAERENRRLYPWAARNIDVERQVA